MNSDDLKLLNKGHRQRLREKILSSNIGGISECEVLECFLFATSVRCDTKPLAKKLLSEFGSLLSLCQADVDQIKAINGVNDAVISIIKCIDLTLYHTAKEKLRDKVIISNWKLLLNYLKSTISLRDTEHLIILYLNKRNVLISDEIQCVGTVDQTPFYCREIIKRALILGASNIIVSHNHPSGSADPSEADINVTLQLNRTCIAVDINLIDHIIMTKDKHFSFCTNGLL